MQTLLKITLLLLISFNAFSQSESLNIGGKISDEKKIAMRDAVVSVTRDGKAFTAFPTSLSGS